MVKREKQASMSLFGATSSSGLDSGGFSQVNAEDVAFRRTTDGDLGNCCKVNEVPEVLCGARAAEMESLGNVHMVKAGNFQNGLIVEHSAVSLGKVLLTQAGAVSKPVARHCIPYLSSIDIYCSRQDEIIFCWVRIPEIYGELKIRDIDRGMKPL